ncbi:MAG: spondin domain-containing protein [Candidatus Tectomicrobia bacterium]|nr:spondin domain-containing protein [Candidatus Tectomicrobia bacterium]
MKKIVICAVIAMVAAMSISSIASATTRTIEVTIHNLSKLILTPPFIAATRHSVAYFRKGSTASEALEMLAEGGDTGALKAFYEDNGGRVVALSDAIPPGGSATVRMEVWHRTFLALGTMLLPTNDAFTGMQRVRVWHKKVVSAGSFDSGTELNDELCANIPGPVCGGEGFNADRSDTIDIVHPHPTLHGQGDERVNPVLYDWSDPVIRVTMRFVHP